MEQNAGRYPKSKINPIRSSCNEQSTPMEHVRIIDKQSLEYVIRSGISGGIAGSAAKTLIAPLDRVKILFQTANPDFLKYRGKFFGLFRASKQIWINDGLVGLFQGHLVTLLRVFPYAAIKFVAYEQIRALLIPTDDYETALRRFMAGSLSGLSSVFFTYPLDLVRVRMAFDTSHAAHKSTHGKNFGLLYHRGKLISIVRSIFNETPYMVTSDDWWSRLKTRIIPTKFQGLTNFYRGFAPTVLGMIPYAGVAFYTHDMFHDFFRSKYLAKYTVQGVEDGANGAVLHKNAKVVRKGSTDEEQVNSRDSRLPLKAHAQLTAGGLAGMFSQTAAYPFEVIRRRMQVGGALSTGAKLTFRNTTRLIFKESGFKGYFVGLSIGYMKVIPMTACSLFVYERCKLLLSI